MFTTEKRATLTPGDLMAGSGCVAIGVICDSPSWAILHAEGVILLSPGSRNAPWGNDPHAG